MKRAWFILFSLGLALSLTSISQAQFGPSGPSYGPSGYNSGHNGGHNGGYNGGGVPGRSGSPYGSSGYRPGSPSIPGMPNIPGHSSRQGIPGSGTPQYVQVWECSNCSREFTDATASSCPSCGVRFGAGGGGGSSIAWGRTAIKVAVFGLIFLVVGMFRRG